MKKLGICILFAAILSLFISSGPIKKQTFTRAEENISYASNEILWTLPKYESGNEYTYEGFITLWNDIVVTGSVCDVSKENYLILNSYYTKLKVADRVAVDEYVFDVEGEYTIKDGMNQLAALYSIAPEYRTSSLDQNTTLILVVVIALIGMTAICVFYSFKDNEIIA